AGRPLDLRMPRLPLPRPAGGLPAPVGPPPAAGRWRSRLTLSGGEFPHLTPGGWTFSTPSTFTPDGVPDDADPGPPERLASPPPGCGFRAGDRWLPDGGAALGARAVPRHRPPGCPGERVCLLRARWAQVRALQQRRRPLLHRPRRLPPLFSLRGIL